VVLIPVQPSPYDVWAAEDLVSIIRARQEITDGKPKAAFMISRAIKRTELGKEVVSALDGLWPMPVFKSKTTQLVTYPKSASVGLTPMDTEPDGNAAQRDTGHCCGASPVPATKIEMAFCVKCCFVENNKTLTF
jgi:chromosome partitioning protein